MPTYEYRCPAGHEFEHFVRKISQAVSELPCPTCGKRAARRISAGGGLVFKGSGFYITDYGKDGKKDQRAAAHAAAKGDTPPERAGAEKGEGAKGDDAKGEREKGASAKGEGAKREGAKGEGAKASAKDRSLAPTTPKSEGKE